MSHHAVGIFHLSPCKKCIYEEIAKKKVNFAAQDSQTTKGVKTAVQVVVTVDPKCINNRLYGTNRTHGSIAKSQFGRRKKISFRMHFSLDYNSIEHLSCSSFDSFETSFFFLISSRKDVLQCERAGRKMCVRERDGALIYGFFTRRVNSNGIFVASRAFSGHLRPQ